MPIAFTSGPGTVGREDRLVRGGIALSLLLLVGFAVAMSGSTGPVSVVFGAFGLYLAVTAALGRDPLYTHSGIDTRTEAELARSGSAHPMGANQPAQALDLRDRQPSDEHRDNSLLGR